MKRRAGLASDRDALQLQLRAGQLEIRVRIHQKLEICFDFCEFKSPQRRIGLQHWNVFARLRFEGHSRINARFASCHTHDFQNRIAVEFVVEPFLVCEEKVGHEC